MTIICSSVIEFGDDEGDNVCTMRCQKSEGHTGFHCESATMMGQRYLVTWEDARDTLAEGVLAAEGEQVSA